LCAQLTHNLFAIAKFLFEVYNAVSGLKSIMGLTSFGGKAMG